LVETPKREAAPKRAKASEKPKPPQVIGPAPTDAISQATKRPAEAGSIVISDIALQHAKNDHPEDFDEAVKVLKTKLRKPEFFGPPKPGAAGQTIAYYYVTLDQTGRAVVLPVSTDRNRYGNYEARSFYIASAHTIDRRLKNGEIFPVK